MTDGIFVILGAGLHDIETHMNCYSGSLRVHSVALRGDVATSVTREAPLTFPPFVPQVM